MSDEPFVCTSGCHGGDFADFDHFCDVMQVKTDELGQAFAAWLNRTTGWDGKATRISGPSTEGEEQSQ